VSLLWPQRQASSTITLVLALFITGCGDSSPKTVSVGEAVASNLGGPVVVEGYLIERRDELRLCEAILESFPPQCGEPSLRVEGKNLSPSEERVTLLGEIENGTLRVASRP
jgi:hypothetical protein